MNKFFLTVEHEDEGIRADKYVSDNSHISRSFAAKLLEEGSCLINQKCEGKNYKVKVGDEVEITLPDAEEPEIVPENIDLDIVYEDKDLLVVNKPKGMVVHPAPGHYSGTLVNALMYYCKGSLSGINGIIRPGIVHRIDKDTSGLLIVAKNDKAHNGLADQIKAHSFTRRYEAIVAGGIKENGTINAPIARHRIDRKRMSVSQEGREAITHYEVIANYGKYSHLRFILETGRTHQIRVHAAYIGHPVAGDPVYGDGTPKWLEGQCLHAREIGFVHPITGENLFFTSPLPEYFKKMLKNIQ
ncbi:MAG: RluA family pseudouridine synthase [Firmicutes bacterium]|nr:RluA family pseudouridine synthase [[Eubacterium] siraeum]MCM1486913.1 RluA family pseudouridine synthase [Bacillota bacterium]